jgi:hypothetical protein
VPKYTVYAQTYKDPRLRAVNGEPVTRVEYHLVEIAPSLIGDWRAICGEGLDHRRQPQSVQRWEALVDSACKNCERLAGKLAREQAESEMAERDRAPSDYQD